jgi:hypothetical protein
MTCLAHTQIALPGSNPRLLDPSPQTTGGEVEDRFPGIHQFQRPRDDLFGWPGKLPVASIGSLPTPAFVADSGHEQVVRNEW